MNYTPNMLVTIALFGYIPLAIILFTMLPARRAVAVAYVLGWLFLPAAAKFDLPGFPDYSKYSAVGVGTFLGALVFDGARLFGFRPKWYDIPAMVMIVCPFMSSVTNGLGVYDGLSQIFGSFTVWGVPYILARVYYSDLAGSRDLAFVVLLGCLAYVPLCWLEIALSPQLHRWIYGYHQHSFAQTKRYGGFRPMVFLDHGIAVGLWMCTGALVSAMLWQSGWPKRIIGMPMFVVTVMLIGTAVAVKSFGALALLILGLAFGTLARWLRLPVLLIVFAMIPIGYMSVRAAGLWDGQEFIDISAQIGGDERGGSLMVRVRNETAHVAKALQQPLFGWGTYNRNRVSIDETGFRSVLDALWVIIIGQRGLVGLLAMIGMLLLPVVLFVTRWGRVGLTHPWLAPGAALCIALIMFISDSLFNAFPNPIYFMAAGAVMGLEKDPRAIAMMQQQTRAMDQARINQARGMAGQGAT